MLTAILRILNLKYEQVHYYCRLGIIDPTASRDKHPFESKYELYIAFPHFKLITTDKQCFQNNLCHV